MEKTEYTYFAFISYKREDERWAKWLQHRLERYHLPSVIRKSEGDFPKSLRPIFRDKTDLGTGVLKESLTQGLQHSKFLIVICSPASAKSQWVGQEISAFIERGKERHIIPFVVDGSLDYNDSNCCLHPALQRIGDELLCVDVREVGKERAFVRVVSGLLNVSFDELWQRHRRYKIHRSIIIVLATAVLLAAAFYTAQLSKPFTAHVAIRQKPLENNYLPLPETGLLVLSYGQKSDTAILSNLGTVPFAEIPGKYHGYEACLHFEMFGFETVDTTLILTDTLFLPVFRDGTYSTIRGTVEDSNGKPIPFARLQMLNYKSISDEDGHFEILIPLADQRPEYRITVSIGCIYSFEQTVFPLSDCLIICKDL